MKRTLIPILVSITIIFFEVVLAMAAAKLAKSCQTEVASQRSTSPISITSFVDRFVDKEAGVVCWIYSPPNGGGISCLPIEDTNLTP